MLELVIPTRMRAAVITAPRTLEICEVDTPEPAPDQVLIRVDRCGVCGSNLPLWEGREWFAYPALPGSPGHEGWGVVVELGVDVDDLQLGDRVAFLSERAFADYDVAPASSVVVLPPALAGSDVPGEPLGCGVIELVGMQRPLELAAKLCRVRGRLVIAGFHQDGPRQVDMFLWNWRGLDVINAHERDSSTYVDGMCAALARISSGGLDPSSLYTHRVPLERASEASELLRMRPDGFVKALVTP